MYKWSQIYNLIADKYVWFAEPILEQSVLKTDQPKHSLWEAPGHKGQN